MNDMERARKLYSEIMEICYEKTKEEAQKKRIDLIANALTEAHERGRKEGLEEALKIVEIMMPNESLALWYSSALKGMSLAIRKAMEAK